ncbi:hypothetical protein ACFW04_006602 [Cataglyphis niger]
MVLPGPRSGPRGPELIVTSRMRYGASNGPWPSGQAYRTVSHRAATVLAGLPSWELVARSHAEIYRRVCQFRGEGTILTAGTKYQLRCQARQILLVRWRHHFAVEQA